MFAGKTSKVLFSLFAFAFLSVSASHSESVFTVTENQLARLEELNRQQQSLIQNQESTLSDLTEQIKALNEQYLNQLTYSARLERKIRIRDSVISVSLGVSVGCVAGVVLYRSLKD